MVEGGGVGEERRRVQCQSNRIRLQWRVKKEWMGKEGEGRVERRRDWGEEKRGEKSERGSGERESQGGEGEERE